MKFILSIFLSALFAVANAQPAAQYFESIRNNEVALTAFFSQMPKGGDLHHHYSGSVYAEPLLQHAIAENFYLNTTTMKVSKNKPDSATGNWEQFSTLQSRGQLAQYKEKIMQKWSAKDYNNVDYPSDDLFFESFDKFGLALDDHFKESLLELKNRAVKENLSYIETQLTTIPSKINTSSLAKYNLQLHKAQLSQDETVVFTILDSIYNFLAQNNVVAEANYFNTDFVAKMHQALQIDDAHFTMRYQNYVLRFMEPVEIFKNFVLAFISANNSPLIEGVNIVSREDGETALKDYWLHMMMYKYCHARYPNVKYAMHAGELTLGLVQPEELTWHIRAAVYTAKASRIGHGVDIAYEDSSYALLRYMAKNKIAAEINLASNEFILKVKENRHPITLYKQFGVPIVISTDDAGILRTNMTEQFVLLAKRYPVFSYADIKQLVYNSIQYSFIEDESLKVRLVKDLDERFKRFESNFPIK
jgi:adenosine deaminase/adenosine deaminase CECR1